MPTRLFSCFRRHRLGSETCAWEVGEAIRLGKRIIPVLSRPLHGVTPPPQLADLDYIFFYEEPRSPGSGWGTGLERLVAALNTDLGWLREHTRYLQRASEWDAGGRPVNRLLSGADIALAKAWAESRPKAALEPTALHLDFIRASEAEESRQQSAEAQRLRQLAEAQAEREAAFAATGGAADTDRRGSHGRRWMVWRRRQQSKRQSRGGGNGGHETNRPSTGVCRTDLQWQRAILRGGTGGAGGLTNPLTFDTDPAQTAPWR
jgi:hypothetical protein